MYSRLIPVVSVVSISLGLCVDIAKADFIYVLRRDSRAIVDSHANANLGYSQPTGSNSWRSTASDYNGNAYAEIDILSFVYPEFHEWDLWSIDYFSTSAQGSSRYYSGFDQQLPRVGAFLGSALAQRFEVRQEDFSLYNMMPEEAENYQRQNISFTFSGAFESEFDSNHLSIQIINETTSEIVFSTLIDPNPGAYFFTGVLPGFSGGVSVPYRLQVQANTFMNDPNSLPSYMDVSSLLFFDSSFSLTSTSVPESAGLGIVGFLVACISVLRPKRRAGDR